MTHQQRFNLHLPGLLKVLAEHLYSSKKVGIRELVQNAHDSCIRRKIESEEPGYQPRIDLTLDLPGRRLIISDNGNGLTEEEINTYLATIGRGYTRELRERLALVSPVEAAELIGQFGLGFLSAFLLASEVTLETRSIKGGPALRWYSTGDENYEITPGSRQQIGTSVMLTIKPTASFILNEETLRETVRVYADFLQVPIHVQGDGEPSNLMVAPWEQPNVESACRNFVARAFRGARPLAILPLEDGVLNLGHDTLTVPLRGFLFVPPGSIASVREYGDLTVYIRRMFICERERDLLPSWARFIRGVVECPLLQPTASREGLHQDDNFDLVRRAIEEQLTRGLRQLSQEDPAIWKKVVRGHADVITGWAVSDNEFFEQVQDIITFRTTRGPLSLPEYLALSRGTIYYVTRELGSLQEQLLAEGRDVPAIEASWFSVTPFLEKYAQRHENVALVQLDGESDTLMKPVSEAPFARLVAHFREQEISVRVASFKPADVPALMLYPQGAELAHQAEKSLEAGDLPGPLAGLIQHYVEAKYRAGDEMRGTLYLNAASELVRRLAGTDSEKLAPAATLLHQVARLFAGRMLSTTEAVDSFRDLTRALTQLMDLASGADT